jgi:NADP-dependent 3-hydroxy acid dehydrogenase YdfG
MTHTFPSADAAGDRRAVVSGATSGIGLEIARMLLSRGGRVIGTGRRAARLRELEEIYPRFHGVSGDMTAPDTLKALETSCEQVFDRTPDVFVVNAGRGLTGSLLQSDDSTWAYLFEVNCLSAMRQLKLAAHLMLRDGSALAHARDIVVLGSVVGYNLSPVNPVYGATKFALHSLVESLRRELAPQGIRVTLIAPGTVTSEFQTVAAYTTESMAANEAAAGPLLLPVDVAEVVRFVIGQPPHVHLDTVSLRPTRQVYP